MNNYCQCEKLGHHHKGKCKDPVERSGLAKCDKCVEFDKQVTKEKK